MSSPLTPADINGEFATVKQFFKAYVNSFVVEIYGEEVATDVDIFFFNQNLSFLLPQKREEQNIYMQFNEFAFSNIPKKECVIIKCVFGGLNFLRAILMLNDSVRIFKIPKYIERSFKELAKYECEEGDKSCFINYELCEFFAGKGYFKNDRVLFSYDILGALENYFLLSHKKYQQKQPIFLLFERFLVYLKQQYKEEYIYLRKKQIESALDLFCSKHEGFFFLTKEQKNAIIQFAIPHHFGESFHDYIDSSSMIID
jgi:hypothetical protein